MLNFLSQIPSAASAIFEFIAQGLCGDWSSYRGKIETEESFKEKYPQLPPPLLPVYDMREELVEVDAFGEETVRPNPDYDTVVEYRSAPKEKTGEEAWADWKAEMGAKRDRLADKLHNWLDRKGLS